MTAKPFHHGNLRAVLLEQAEAMLRREGVDGLSLRELARQADVSHGAPRSHFIDRQALLDALAVQGFNRLTDSVRAVLQGPGPFEERFRLVGRAYVDFAVEDAALMELMFAAKVNHPNGPVQDAAARLFQVFDDVLARSSPDDDSGDDSWARLQLVFAATMQGTATLIAAQRITRSQGESLTDDAVNMMLASELAARVLPRP